MFKPSTLAFATLFFGLQALAIPNPKPVTIDMKLELDGKLVSAPRLVVLMEERGLITQNIKENDVSYSVEVTPSSKAENAVQLNFIVRKMINGQNQIVARPSMIALDKHTARIEQKTAGQPTVRLSVRPNFL